MDFYIDVQSTSIIHIWMCKYCQESYNFNYNNNNIFDDIPFYSIISGGFHKTHKILWKRDC